MTDPAPGGGDKGSARRTRQMRLTADAVAWQMPDDRQADVERHWAVAREKNGRLFNGTVYVLRTLAVSAAGAAAELVPTEFRQFLYWRDNGYQENGIRDVFGAAVIRSADDAVLLGRAAAGTMSAARLTFITGFIDNSDRRPDGTLDLTASTARELAEETGLGGRDLRPEPGFVVATSGSLVLLGVVYRSELTAHALQERMLRFTRLQATPEIDDVVIIRSPDEIACHPHHQTTRLVLDLLASDRQERIKP